MRPLHRRTSNRTILGVSGPDHPLRDYISFGVPVVISTDDEGVARSDVTNEWVQAVSEHRLAYPDLVRMARNSLEYSFLRGESLWEQAPAGEYRRVSSCLRERLDTKEDALADDCQHLLESSEKARHQWRLEKALSDFAAQKWDDRGRVCMRVWQSDLDGTIQDYAGLAPCGACSHSQGHWLTEARHG